MFEDLRKSQPNVVKMLENSFRKDKLVHAFLFEGAPGTMKYQAALYLSMLLLCKGVEKKPCGTCNNCKRIISGQHTNVLIVEPVNGIIRKEQIESLIKELSVTSLVTGRRVFILKDAEMMNISAANTLLKFLEEPFVGQYLILLSTNTQLLPSTIRSRVQLIHFGAPSVIKMHNLLVEKSKPITPFEKN